MLSHEFHLGLDNNGHDGQNSFNPPHRQRQRLNNENEDRRVTCPLCQGPISSQHISKLRGCTHLYCKFCIVDYIMHNADRDGQVRCPWPRKPCPNNISQEEISALLGPDYEKFAVKVRHLRENEGAARQRELPNPAREQENGINPKILKQIDRKNAPANKKHMKVEEPVPIMHVISRQKCTISNCDGTLEAGPKLNELACNVCRIIHCIGCNANHQDQTCQQYRKTKRIHENDRR